MEYFFMFVGLGFLVFIIWMVQADEDRRYHRRLDELRERRALATEKNTPQPHKKE